MRFIQKLRVIWIVSGKYINKILVYITLNSKTNKHFIKRDKHGKEKTKAFDS